MARAPFSLFLRGTQKGKVWYVRYLNPDTEQYDITKSTGVFCVGKKGRKLEAYEWARENIPTRTVESQNFITYIESFWADDSEYLRMKRVTEKKVLSYYYLKLNREGIRLHVKPYNPFEEITLEKLRPGMIDDWKLWALERGTGIRRVNQVLQSMKVAVRYSVSRGELEKDPFQTVKKIPYKPKDRGVLTFEEVKQLIAVDEFDPRVYAGMLLALLTGMRRGEVRGLLWGDIDFENAIIDVKHNYVEGDGKKGCKWDSSRKVPMVPALAAALKKLQVVSEHTDPSDYVLFDLRSKLDPCPLHTHDSSSYCSKTTAR